MRISDWSSDVCSSDLINNAISNVIVRIKRISIADLPMIGSAIFTGGRKTVNTRDRCTRGPARHKCKSAQAKHADPLPPAHGNGYHKAQDQATRARKRVEYGKGASLRVDLGALRIVNKKNNEVNRKELR